MIADALALEQRIQAAWDEVRAFAQSEARRQGEARELNPQFRLAPELFGIYLAHRPSALATKALDAAFTMWGNLEDISHQVEEALRQISYEEDVWDVVVHGTMRSMFAEERREEALALLEELVQKVQPLNSRSALLFELGRSWKGRSETAKARGAFTQVIEWNAVPRLVERSHGHLFEFDHLNIGQDAPQFSLVTIDGRRVDLAACRGQVVVLQFWSTTCGWCDFLLPHLRQVAWEHAGRVALVGFSSDDDLEALRAKVAAESLTWPQVCEGQNWRDYGFRLYNVEGTPCEYVIDRAGRITAKLSGWGEGSGLEFEQAVTAALG